MVAANRLTKWTLEKQAAYNAQSLSENEPVKDNPNWWPVAVLLAFLAGWFIGRGN